MILSPTHSSKYSSIRNIVPVLLVPLLLVINGCASQPESTALPQPQDPVTPTFQSEHAVDLLSTLTPELPSLPYSIWIDPHFPAAVHEFFSFTAEFAVLQDQQDASITTSVKSGTPFGAWTYILVAPFPSLVEDLESSDLLTFWQTGISSSTSIVELTLSEETKLALTLLWGEPDPGALIVLEADSILSFLWANPKSISIIPFEQLTPYLKILSLDGQNPLSPDFVPDQYDLTFPIYLSYRIHTNPRFIFAARMNTSNFLKSWGQISLNLAVIISEIGVQKQRFTPLTSITNETGLPTVEEKL
jgi:hypothetical protein